MENHNASIQNSGLLSHLIFLSKRCNFPSNQREGFLQRFASFFLALSLISFFCFEVSHGQCLVNANAPLIINSGGTVSLSAGTYDDIIIDNNTTVELSSNQTVLMNSGKRIIVNPGSTLFINDGTIENAVANCMWGGIELVDDPSNQFGGGGWCILQVADIINANIGVHVGRGGVLSCLFATFDQNYIGVQLGDPLQTFSNISFELADTKFTCTNTLIGPYAGQLPNPNPGSHPLAGIASYHANTIAVIPFSTTTIEFENLNCGILSFNENLFVENCKFTDIDRYDFYGALPSQGTGICAVGLPDNILDKRIGHFFNNKP